MDEQSRALGKRLISESLLSYKNVKQWRGRTYYMTDFMKQKNLQSRKSDTDVFSVIHQDAVNVIQKI